MFRTIAKAAAVASILIALTPAALAATPQAQVNDLTNTFRAAGAGVDRLQVYELSGIVIIRGRTSDKAQAEQLNRYAQSLGYVRVANLIQTVEHNDDAITRAAERELTIHRSLDGCKFRVSSANGIVRLGGTVQHELQKDVALSLVRSVDGVRGVEVNLQRF
jgi:osmotically-inducible protein OsmY